MCKLEELKREELIILKNDIENRLSHMESLKNLKKSNHDKKYLSDLEKGDTIFYISFNNGEVQYIDYVNIYFGSEKNGWVDYTTSHPTKPLGCSSAIQNKLLNKSYFLSTGFGNDYRFYTMNPLSWKEDLKSELVRLHENKLKEFNQEIKEMEKSILGIIDTNCKGLVDVFLSNIS